MSASGRGVYVGAGLAGAGLFLAGVLAGTLLAPGGGRAGGASREGGAAGVRPLPDGTISLAGGGRALVGPARAGGAGAGASAGARASVLTPGAEGARAPRGEGHDHGDSGEGEAVAAASTSVSLDDAVSTLVAEESGSFAARYAAELRRDRRALEQALARLRTETDEKKLAALAALLAELRSPEVEALATELALRGDRARRLAALAILDRFETPAALAPVAETLRAERDPAVLAAAVHALPEPRGAAAEESAPVVDGLRRALASPDAEVRRRALIALASWVPAVEAEPILADALARDPDAVVRAGAAFGLEVVRPRLETTLALLGAVIARRAEDRLVRENAWRALGSVGPLPPELAAVYRAFAIEMEARDE